MPAVAGVGFTDVGSGTPGTDSSQFGAADWARCGAWPSRQAAQLRVGGWVANRCCPHNLGLLSCCSRPSTYHRRWRPGFYARLAAQARRAASLIGCTCGACGAPAVVAFSGKTQFAQLFLEGGGGGGGRGKKAAAAAAGASGTAAVAAAAPAAPAMQAQASSSSSPPERAPALQSRRPSSITPGRQWVLPDGWPLPLSTEVRWQLSLQGGDRDRWVLSGLTPCC